MKIWTTALFQVFFFFHAAYLFSQSVGWTPIVPQSPDHVNWFGEPDLVFGERFFEENSESIADAFSAASADGVPSGKSEDGYEEEWIQSLREGDGAAATHHINLDHKIETVTIVTGIDKAIHLSRLCDANPEIFGVRSLRMITLIFLVSTCF